MVMPESLCICMYIIYKLDHQCQLPRVTNLSASRVFALVDGRKNITSAGC